MAKIFEDIEFQLDMLSCIISNLRENDYSAKGKYINSIGAHVRHMIEYVQILINSDLLKPINYGNRKRDELIENKKEYARRVIEQIKVSVVKPDQKVFVVEDGELYESSYLREMLYMNEHIIHHCALLKIELNSIPYLEIEPCFGFAKSTLKHMETNVSS